MAGEGSRPRRGYIHNLLLQIATAASFWLFAEHYAAYRLMRWLGNLLHRRPCEIQPAWSLDQDTVVIDGFRHSANSFVVGNVHPRAARQIRSHVHRPWILKAAIRAGAPAVVLVRAPLDTCLSLCHRSRSGDVVNYGVALSPLFALLAWIGYYRVVWKLRRRLTLVDFDELAADPAGTLQRIAERTGLPLRDEVSYATRHRFDGPRPALPLGVCGQGTLRVAEALHGRLRAHMQAAAARDSIGRAGGE